MRDQILSKRCVYVEGKYSCDVDQLAGRLGGSCIKAEGNRQYFLFNLESYAWQFLGQIHNFPNVENFGFYGGDHE